MKSRISEWINQVKVWFQGLQMVWGADRKRFAILFFLTSVDAVIGPLLTWLSAQIIDLVSSSPSVVQIGAIGFWLLAIFFVGTLLLDTLHPFTVYQKRLLSTKLQGRMDELLMQKAAEIEAYDVYEKSTFYTSVRSFRNNEYFVTLWLDMILDAMGGVILIVTSFVFLWEIALWFPLALLIVSFPKLYMEVQLSNATFEGRDELIEMRRRAEYFLSLPLTPELAQEVKLFRLVPFFQEKYQNVMRNLLAALYRDQRKWVFHSFLWGILQVVVITIAIFLVINQARHGSISTGQVLLFLGMVFQFGEGVNQFFSIFAIGAREGNHLKNLLTFLHTPMGELSSGERRIGLEIQRGFYLEDVSYSYREGQVAFQADRLEIPSGKITALIGKNGAGKSTLVKLLLRLYEPQTGQIYYNGIPLQAYDLQAYRDHCTAVFQDFVRYEESFLRNVTFGEWNKHNHKELFQQSVQKAKLTQLMQTLPEKEDTKLGRLFGGQDLSGGQWQRIAIARAFMRDPKAKLLVFDEPSSALDAYTEYEIIQSLKQLGENKTVIFVTHHLASAKLADHILVLDQGRIIEQGDHHTLIEKDGIYTEWVRLYQEMKEGKKLHPANEY